MLCLYLDTYTCHFEYCEYPDQKLECGTMDTSHPPWSPLWLHSGSSRIVVMVAGGHREYCDIQM